MPIARSDAVFAGSIPELYETRMVPAIFAPYAPALAAWVAAAGPSRVLELAAGTGAATRALAEALPAHVALVATDLHPPMLDRARAIGVGRAIDWRQADAHHLPFDDGSFDAVACQFGVMFFPDRVGAYREVHRVLVPGGSFVFSTWDTLAHNTFAEAVNQAVTSLFPEDPPRFFERTPHGYADQAAIRADLAAAGFGEPRIEALTRTSRAATPLDVALAFCQGTPLRAEIEARAAGSLGPVTVSVADAVARRFGDGPIEGTMRAHLVSATR
ncbi:MAG: class I SAM-dependent methyltransferase [Myxococcota bacterium]